ncbi:hypothetical protein C1N58_12675 [Pantoea sp. SGAir0180]
MKLIDLLVKELPNLGGWPGGYTVASNGINGTVIFHSKGRAPFIMGGLNFSGIGCVSYEEYEAALAASKQPEWDVQWLPPVGCECEREVPRGWSRCKINYASGSIIVYQMLDSGKEYASTPSAFRFRPIRKEAERKREEAIAAMRNFATNYNNTAVIHAIEQVYDSIAAGKIPHVTLK